MVQIKNFTIGSDPEFAAVKVSTGQVTSVIGYLGGTKQKPLSIGEGCSRQEDNVMAEFCIPPCNTRNEFITSINYCKLKGNEILSEYGLELLPISSHLYSEEDLDNFKARRFGCSPSYSAYTRDVNIPPRAYNVGNLRSCGFHVHVGFPKEGFNPDDATLFIKYMDVCLGVPSIILDSDSERRKLYGKAGDYRPRMIDDLLVIEYRSLGGGLLRDSKTIGWVYDGTINAINMFNQRATLPDEQLIQDCINSSDVDLAKNICKDYEQFFSGSIWEFKKESRKSHISTGV